MSGRLRGVLTALAPGLLAVLALSACADDVAPSPTPRPVTVASPTPEPSHVPTPPQQTAAMATADDSGAEAAATYFVELYEYVTKTGDTTTWEASGEAACGFCTTTTTEVRALYDSGGRQDGGDLEVLTARSVAFDETFKIFAVEVHFRAEEAVELGPDGAVDHRYPAEEGYLLLEVGYLPGDGWKLVTGSAREEAVA
ncbi:DUF6318 family protein [Cellulomonas carbonis]|uniref:DUF6318 domain-containing protein n=1 Tax=Cellulomonas carbonis T26 TaxID=947969 RepID=A0A0A0BWS5_9CELL|nr:DUF6318 family protein [Cellulomonas carbonis]KGM12828.1 hypothetical protein N868_00670 [Cellulomonas carbonis T26]